jgi:glycerophosphoryl diester phosphodiesterase
VRYPGRVQTGAAVTFSGRHILLTCHSGQLAGDAMSNSLAAIETCLRAGASRIEIDVHSLAGDDYLVCHANRLEEVSTSNGPVGRISREQAFALHDKRDPSLRVPLLSEVIDLVRGFSSELQLDLKDWRPLTAERVATLGRLVTPLAAQVIVSSGQDWNLRALGRGVPDVGLGFDPDHYMAAGTREAPVPARIGAYGYRDDHPLALGRAQPVEDYLRERVGILLGQVPTARELFIDYPLLLQAEADGVRLPELLHERSVTVSAWTLDYDGEESLATLSRLAAAGVDRITTNTSQQFVAALTGRSD